MTWRVIETKKAAKELLRLPKKIGLIYSELVDDMEKEGPHPYGWDVSPLKGRNELRVKLTREYRVIIQVFAPNIIVVKIAHRKEAYE